MNAARADGLRPSLHRARKRFGQHFLERAWVDKVVAAIAPQPDDVFLEVGAGRGALTEPLLAAARHVVAFEIDRDLAHALRAAAHPNLTVVEGDFLDVSVEQLADRLRATGLDTGALRLAGNLPYNVASPILFRCLALFESGLPLRDAVVMLQREVADRIVAPPGTREYGVLSVLLRHVATVDRLFTLPPGAFRPPPQVHSALLRLQFHDATPRPLDLALFRALTRAVFTRRRKTLSNALDAFAELPAARRDALLATAGIDGRLRPEALDISALVRLADAFATGHRG